MLCFTNLHFRPNPPHLQAVFLGKQTFPRVTNNLRFLRKQTFL
jgi:hypothetical protein